jgi:short-subunit dehydrogenase
MPVVLVTGASQGIGAAIAHVFAKELRGVKLALVARSEKNLQRTAAACRKAGAKRVEIFACDVSEEAAVQKMAADVKKMFGAIDVLINNAGVFRAVPFLEMTTAAFDELVAANLRSVFLVSRALVPAMAKRGAGHVFNMSSIAGLGAYPNSAGYCAAKFGVTGLTRVMREELKKTGVKVTLVCPGATVSPWWAHSGVPEQRLMPASVVARAFYDIYSLIANTVVEEVVLRPQLGDL